MLLGAVLQNKLHPNYVPYCEVFVILIPQYTEYGLLVIKTSL